jgi:D-tyrosyl-tRNA(Tyr) deacylase
LAAGAVAKATLDAIKCYQTQSNPAVIGIGGPHYNAKFTKIALEGPTSFGHMVPKYCLSEINADLLQQCVARTQGKVVDAILDWKGIPSNHKARILQELSRIQLPYKKV